MPETVPHRGCYHSVRLMKQKKMPVRPTKLTKSDGFVLLLIVLSLMAIGGTIFLVGMGSGLVGAERSAARRAAAGDTLAQARLALLGYAVRETNGGTGYRLGNFPTPDSLANGQYDGTSDGDKCLSNSGTGIPPITGNSANKRCVGKFPWKDFSLDLGVVDANDALGRVPWLAISANLSFWDTCIEVLNSEVLNAVAAAYTCPSAAGALPHPWLTVRNEMGATLSNRVAAVLILPGAPITTETRSQSRNAQSPNQTSDGRPSDYLDSIRLPLGCSIGCTATYDNAGLNNEFIAIPLGTRYPANSEDVTKRNANIAFNDVLIYITIDELIPILERRVSSEMAAALRDVSGTPPKKNIGYPWAATFVSPTNYANFNSQPLSLLGLFPFFVNTESVTPLGGYPPYLTALDWTVTGLSSPARSCAQVRTGPNRWIDTRERITSAVAAAGSLPSASTSCTWKGVSALFCTGTSAVPLTSSYTLFSTATRCNNGTPNSGTASYTRQRTINFTADATCATSSASYFAANATQPQRWTWSCPSVANTFNVDVTDQFTTTPIAVTGNAFFNAAGRSVTTTTKYQPLMPYWFYQNEWYKTAFYALSPSKAPSAGATDCGGATALTVGGTSVSTAVALLAGSRLPNLPSTPTQIRPSTVVTNYLEGFNATAATNCTFAGSGTAVNSSFNDQLIVFEP